MTRASRYGADRSACGALLLAAGVGVLTSFFSPPGGAIVGFLVGFVAALMVATGILMIWEDKRTRPR